MGPIGQPVEDRPEDAHHQFLPLLSTPTGPHIKG